LQILLTILGGVALLLLGMHMAGEGLQQAAGARLRAMVNTLTTTRLRGLMLGTAMTAIMQSSGATTVLLVSFVGAGLLSFEQTIAVILGANIGTTVTVQLIAFKITDYAMGLVALGFLVSRIARKSFLKHMGHAILGFGLIFLAIHLFGQTMAPLKDAPIVADMMVALGRDIWLGVLLGALATAAVNSSAAIIGLTLVLASHEVMPLATALPLMLGANVGTCATSLLASVGAPLEAKRVAAVHTLVKVSGVLIAVPLLEPFTRLVMLTAEDAPRQIAMGHTIFNVGLSLMFLPLAGPLAHFIKRVLPNNPSEEVGFQIRYLDERILSSPVLALGAANREVRRMADRVQIMMSEAMALFLRGDEDILDRLEKLEIELDALTRAIINYLANLSQNALTAEESRKAASILYIVNDLEHIGDALTKLALQGRKVIDLGLSFSPEGVLELVDMHQKVTTNLDMAIVAFMTSDRALAESVVETKPKIARLERDLRQAHLGRLWAGLIDTRNTSAIHLELINGWQRINDHAADIAMAVLEVSPSA